MIPSVGTRPPKAAYVARVRSTSAVNCSPLNSSYAHRWRTMGTVDVRAAFTSMVVTTHLQPTPRSPTVHRARPSRAFCEGSCSPPRTEGKHDRRVKASTPQCTDRCDGCCRWQLRRRYQWRLLQIGSSGRHEQVGGLDAGCWMLAQC